MIRTRTNKTPQLIITSDWHLREDTPVCRTDNFWEAQWRKVDFVKELQERYGCPVIHAGDLFHHWKPSPYLLSETIKHIPDMFHTVYGQHDLPQHSHELANKSGVYTLAQAGILEILYECHWGQQPTNGCTFLTRKDEEGWKEISKVKSIRPPTSFKQALPLTSELKVPRILVWHKLVYKGAKPFPEARDGQAIEILHKYPQFDLLIFGDNHQAFTATYGKQLLVNPGSLTRQAADQVDFEPRVYLWYAETNTVEPVYLPIDEGVISREHIERKEERDGRLEAFISRLNTEYKTEISFEDNLRAFEQANTVNTKIMSIIYKAIEQ